MLLLIALLKYQLRNVFYEIYATTITNEKNVNNYLKLEYRLRYNSTDYYWI